MACLYLNEKHILSWKKGFVDRVNKKNYNFNQRLCSASDRICAIFSHMHGVVWFTPKKKERKKPHKLQQKKALCHFLASVPTVTIGYCSALGKRQLSIQILPLRETVAADSNASEMAKPSRYVVQSWDTECLDIGGWKFGSTENQRTDWRRATKQRERH